MLAKLYMRPLGSISVTPSPSPLISICPEPTVDVDWLQAGGLAAFVPEVALPSTCPHGSDVVCKNKQLISKHDLWIYGFNDF